MTLQSSSSQTSIRSIEPELDKFIDFLRSKGVLQFAGHGISLSLIPDAPVVASVVPDEAAPKQEPKRGRDGLTAEEQAELYGRSMSDTRS
jgi:hypothetical protein